MNKQATPKPVWREWLESLGFALGIAFIIRTFLFGLYHVPTGSAEPNLLVGDRIWGNKLVYRFSPIKRGDLIICDNPVFDYAPAGSINNWWQHHVGIPIPFVGLHAGPDNWTKRVIGVPGDTVEGRIEDGKTAVYVNGSKLAEPYVNRLPLIVVERSKGFIPFNHFGPIPIPDFLTHTLKQIPYTYDPSKPYDQQPYYHMSDNAVVKQVGTGKPFFLLPGTPCIDQNGCRDTFGPLVIPAGKYWVMGDNRKGSLDSRWWGLLDEKLIHGRASFVIWSLDSEEAFWLFDFIKHPIDFCTKHMRWNRFFKGLSL